VVRSKGDHLAVDSSVGEQAMSEDQGRRGCGRSGGGKGRLELRRDDDKILPY